MRQHLDIVQRMDDIGEAMRKVDAQMYDAEKQVAFLSKKSAELKNRCMLLNTRLDYLKQKTNALHQGFDLLSMDMKIFPNADVSQGRMDVRILESSRLKTESRELLNMINACLLDMENEETRRDEDHGALQKEQCTPAD